MPPFGGKAGQFAVLTARPQPPVRVYRIIPGQVWWTLLHWPWRQYRAAVNVGTPGVSPPTLAPLGHCPGCESPSDFAYRMSLSAQAQQECQLFGCARGPY